MVEFWNRPRRFKFAVSNRNRLALAHPTMKPIKSDLFETYARFMTRFLSDGPIQIEKSARNQWVYENHQFSIDYRFGYDSRIRDIEYI